MKPLITKLPFNDGKVRVTLAPPITPELQPKVVGNFYPLKNGRLKRHRRARPRKFYPKKDN